MCSLWHSSISAAGLLFSGLHCRHSSVVSALFNRTIMVTSLFILQLNIFMYVVCKTSFPQWQDCHFFKYLWQCGWIHFPVLMSFSWLSYVSALRIGLIPLFCLPKGFGGGSNSSNSWGPGGIHTITFSGLNCLHMYNLISSNDLQWSFLWEFLQT